MPLRIATDSACDLPEPLVERYRIGVLPLFVQMGERSWQDRVDLPREAFYRRLPDADPPPATAAPGVGQFLALYERLAAEGATEILSIHLAGSLSATLNAARMAAEQVQRVRVEVFDSGQLSMGLGLQVLAAAEAAAAGRVLEEVRALLEAVSRRTYLFAALETLEYLRRSGRVNPLLARFGDLLGIRPLIRLYRGALSPGRARTWRRALATLRAWTEEVAPLERIALLYTTDRSRAEALLPWARELVGGAEVPVVQATPVIGTHVGPGAVGVACVARSGSS